MCPLYNLVHGELKIRATEYLAFGGSESNTFPFLDGGNPHRQPQDATRITLADCLCSHLLCVQASQCYLNVIHDLDPPKVFAVFKERRYLGLVTEKEAAKFPDRAFADLPALTQPDPLPKDASLDKALECIRRTQADYLPVVDESANILGVVSQQSLFDKLTETERKLREERMALIGQIESDLENLHMAYEVFDNTSEGIVVTDSNASIILTNRAFTETTGYALDEVKGRKPNVLSSGRHDKDFYAAMWKSLQETGAWNGEIWNRRKSGDIYPEWLRINAVKDSHGQVTHYVGVFSDISNQEHIQRHLQQMAYYDELTDLPNRQLFCDRIEQAIVHARREGLGFALLFVDFDRFKDINDSLGHSFGDRLLQMAAQRLKQVVRESDTVARLGGDEFTVILPGTAMQWDIAAVAAKIVESFSQTLDVDDRKIFLTASVGIARYPGDGEDVETLMKNADTAMYLAKEEGRNRYCFFTSQLNVEVSKRLDLENALRSSLTGEGLSLMWQPQVSLTDGHVVGFEALARWHHSQLGEIPPAQFIPLAERAGLMQEFGAWVLRAVASDVANLAPLCKNQPFRFAVNISPSQMYDAYVLKKTILDTLGRSGFKSACFELELTESTFMTKGRAAEALLDELGRWGLQIAVDDFGTGYSNLGYLKRFAVHHLKIDQSFVHDLVEDDTSRQIVTAIVKMAHSMNIEVIAEGVETEEQKYILLYLGCDEGQGYLFGRPMEASRLIEQKSTWLARC